MIWQCNAKFKGEHKCTTPHLTEEQIKDAYKTALSQPLENREALYDDVRLIMQKLTDCTTIDKELQEICNEAEVVARLIRQCIENNAAKIQNQVEYEKRYLALTERYEALQARLAALENEREERTRKNLNLSGCLFELGELFELEPVFSEQCWRATVEQVTVFNDGRLVFRFKNNVDITVEM